MTPRHAGDIIASAKLLGHNYTEQCWKQVNQSNASVLLVGIHYDTELQRKPDAIALTAGRPSSAQRIDPLVFTPPFEAELLSGWFRSPRS